MFVSRLLLLVAGACLFSRCSCVIWDSKQNREELIPQVFEIRGGRQLQAELQEIAEHVTGRGVYSNKFQKRQAEEEEDGEESISTAFTLANDTHLFATVHWTGYPSENIFILTRDSISNAQESWLWRSTDYGRTFVNETHKLNNSTIQLYYIGPSRSNLFFADVINQRLQITEDVGETFTSVDIPFRPDWLRFQSRSAPDSITYTQYILGYDAQEQTLWVTSDLGYNWKKLGDNVPTDRYFWRRLDEDVEGDLSTVYFEQRTSNTSNVSQLYFATFPYDNVQLFSADLGVFDSESFLLVFDYMFVQKPGSASSSNLVHSSPLWVSYRRASHFTQAMFPLVSEELEHVHYTVVDASEGIVYMAIYHNANATNLYVSDATGISYALSLPYIASPPGENWGLRNPSFDIHVVNGIDGTVFANQRVPGRDFGTTLVSHNKGGQWAPLRPPAVDVNGQPIVCAPPECSLHLRMESDVSNGYQSILSVNTAVGLIMAVGNVGRNLTRSTSSAFTQVYLSRDGGFTWAEVEKRIWEFQFLALGSIIIMVRKRALVNSVKWSCDEGATWTTSVIDDSPEGFERMTVIGMKTEFGEKPRFVTVFGIDYLKYIANDFEVEWIIYTLNFTSVVNQLCDNTTDYYDWIPTDERQDGNCLLGEVVTYERRNSTACCYVDPEYQKPVNNSVCPCTLEDYECDFGFQRSSLTAPCTPVFGFTYPPPTPPNCPEGTNYTYSQGYRKIPGDKCVKNDNLDLSFLQPITVPCPVQIATGLSISYDPQFIQPNVPVGFTLTQNRGSRVSTVYRWSFNDSTPDVEVTGLGMAATQEHTFAAPGVYTVRLSTSNEAGTSETTTTVTVLDSLMGFSVQYPSAIFNDTVPINIFLEFSAAVTTKFGTRILSVDSPYEISWDFGDGRVVSGSQTSVSYVYQVAGNFNISTTVRAQFSDVGTVLTRTVRTYIAARTVGISSDGLLPIDDRLFAQVGQLIQFRAIPPPPTEIPQQSIYMWQVQQPAGALDSFGDMETISFNFPTWGLYRVTLTGSYLITGLFVGTLEIDAQSVIKDAIVDSPGTTRSGALITMLVSPRVKDGSVYNGPISVTLDSSNGLRLVTHSSTVGGDAAIELRFSLKQKGSMNALLNISNDISKVTQDLKFVSVDPGEYGVVSIVFDTDTLPSNYNDREWQKKLSSSLGQFISSKYSRDRSLIEVEGITTVPTEGRSRRMVKRASRTLLVVDVNILPEDYTDEDILAAIKIVDKIIADVGDKTFTFTVDGVVLRADNAYDPDKGYPVQIIDPTTQSSPVIDIVLGVVFAVFIIVFLAVLVIVIYYCHRRYKQLNTKYSHLEETAGGNLTFNEAFGESESKEEGLKAEKA